MEWSRLMTVGNTGGWRNFANTQKRVAQPSDMEGLKIRTVVADLPQELVKALGASPTPIPWPELFTSFQTGVVEGSKNGITDIMNMKFPDAGLKYVTLDGHAYMGALWFMNNERFMSLDPALRRVVIDGFYALQQATFASPKRKSIQAYQDFQAPAATSTCQRLRRRRCSRKPLHRFMTGSRPMLTAAERIYNALTGAVAEVEAEIDATRMADSQ